MNSWFCNSWFNLSLAWSFRCCSFLYLNVAVDLFPRLKVACNLFVIGKGDMLIHIIWMKGSSLICFLNNCACWIFLITGSDPGYSKAWTVYFHLLFITFSLQLIPMHPCFYFIFVQMLEAFNWSASAKYHTSI